MDRVPAHFVFLCLVFIQFIAVTRSNVSVQRRASTKADWFSNPSSSCDTSACGKIPGSSGCAENHCCTCQCLHDRATYYVHEKLCKANNETYQECLFSFSTSATKPLVVLDLSKKNGHKKFYDSRGNLISCDTNMTVAKWGWQDIAGQWQQGTPTNFFFVENKAAGPPGGSRFAKLKWDGQLSARYFGLLLKFHLQCGNKPSGCLMMKTKGNFTYPSLEPTAQHSTYGTTVAATTNGLGQGGEGDGTTGVISTTGVPTKVSTTSKVLATQVSDQADDAAESQSTAFQSTTQPDGAAAGGNNAQLNEPSNDQPSSNKSALVIGLAVVSGLFAILLLVCAAYCLVKRRRKKQIPGKGIVQAPEEVYEDPLYSKLSDVSSRSTESFDNPTYEVGTDKPVIDNSNTNKRRSRPPSLPLPPIPGQQQGSRPDSVYQGLVKSPDPTAAVHSPDYDNPVGEKGQVPNSISDYENPPVQTSTSPNPPQYDSPSASCPPPQNISQTAAPKGGQTEDYLAPCDSQDLLSDPIEYHVLESPYQDTPSDPSEYHVLESPYQAPNPEVAIREPDHHLSAVKAWLSADRTF